MTTFYIVWHGPIDNGTRFKAERERERERERDAHLNDVRVEL